MIKAEWQYLWKHKFYILVMLAVMMIPALYNIIFLSSMWDPYGKVKDLPVAVVNLDQPTTLNNKEVAVGDQLVENMKKSKALDFHYTTEKKAEKGIKNGDYYMVITIPASFSTDTATLLTDSPKKPTLDYQTTQGRNYTASKMAHSAISELKAKVATNITDLYTSAILTQFSKAGDGMKDASEGVAKLSDGTVQLTEGSQQISDNLTKLSSSSLTFAEGSETLSVGLNSYLSGVTQLNSGVTQVSDGSAQLVTGSQSLNAGINNYTDGVSELNNGIQVLSQTLSGDDVTKLTESLPLLQQGINQLNESVSNPENEKGFAQMLLLIATMKNSLESLKTSISAPDYTAITNAAIANLEQSDSYNAFDDSQKTAMSAAITEAITSQSSSATDNTALITQIDGLIASLTALESGVNSTISSSSTLKEAIGQINSNANVLLPGANKTITSVQSAVSQQLAPGSHALSENSANLKEGSSTLNAGAVQLNSGITQVSEGSQKLVENGPALSSGAIKLTDGATQIADGSEKLSTGSEQIVANLTKVNDGLFVLNTNLADGAEQISTVQTKKVNANAVSSPVKLSHKDTDKVANNGTAMAPYMMSVALFVGGITTTVMFDTFRPKKRIESVFKWWLSKVSILGTIAVAQALLIYFWLVPVLGLNPLEHGKTLGFLVLESLAYMSIISFLNMWLGKVGSFIALLLLLIQLGGTGGTYPTILSNDFFKAIHNYLPMTYALEALRSTLSIGESILTPVIVFVALIAVFNGLMLVVFTRRKRNFNLMALNEQL